LLPRILKIPYGERASRASEDHQTMDFTLKGFDSEIGAVRMGRRYYDSEAKRFLTPDGYFLENYDKILESPVEGNLYSYAGNNPISYTDPTGKSKLGALALTWLSLKIAGKKAIQKILAKMPKPKGLKTKSVVATKKSINNANHIFGTKNMKKHKLEGLLKKHGGNKLKAFESIQKATNKAVRNDKVKGLFEKQIKIKGETITVRGNAMKDRVEIGTVFKK
jgi:RHS repeat-associated protein